MYEEHSVVLKIGNGLQQVVYTQACMQMHMKTLTHTVTVTKITTAPTGFTNTDKDCNLHLSGLDFEKKKMCLAGVENCCFDIKKSLSYFFVIQML